MSRPIRTLLSIYGIPCGYAMLLTTAHATLLNHNHINRPLWFLGGLCLISLGVAAIKLR